MKPPKNVRVIYSDGTEVPAECVYAGQNEEGCAEWQIVTEVDLSRVSGIHMDELPAKTSVILGLEAL